MALKEEGTGFTPVLPIIASRNVNESTATTTLWRQYIKHVLTYDNNHNPIRLPAELVLRRTRVQRGGGAPVTTITTETFILAPNEEKELKAWQYVPPPPFIAETNSYQRISLRFIE